MLTSSFLKLAALNNRPWKCFCVRAEPLPPFFQHQEGLLCGRAHFHSQAPAADSQAGGSPLSCELCCLWVLSDLQVYPLWAHPATRVAGCRLYALVVLEDIAQVTLRGPHTTDGCLRWSISPPPPRQILVKCGFCQPDR